MSRVLVIDDDENIQLLVQAALQAKFELVKAMTGQEGLDRPEEELWISFCSTTTFRIWMVRKP